MSIYATVGNNESAFFSSLQGWKDVTTWTEGLDVDQFGDVVHLSEHGFVNNAGTLSEQLQAAMKSDPPPKEVGATVLELIELLENESGEVIVNSGMEE